MISKKLIDLSISCCSFPGLSSPDEKSREFPYLSL
jgi:hypothetical protein